MTDHGDFTPEFATAAEVEAKTKALSLTDPEARQRALRQIERRAQLDTDPPKAIWNAYRNKQVAASGNPSDLFTPLYETQNTLTQIGRWP